MTYLLGKNGVEYNKSDLVSECTRYYLLSSPTLSDKDISNIRSTLNESYCITNEDIDKVSFIFEEELPTDTIDDIDNNGNELAIYKKEKDEMKVEVMLI